MLQIHDLTVTMKNDLRPLIRDLTFSLEPGDKIAVIGEEGNGKSTLLKLICDETFAEDYAEWSGRIQKDGMILGYLSQELTPAQLEMTVRDFCLEEPAFSEASPGDLASAAGELGLPQSVFYDGRKMKTLSGGEKVKLRMALLSLKRPDCWLLDEPSNDLDLDTLRWLEAFIRGCRQPVLYISHDETLLENTAGAILHLEIVRKKTLPRWTMARMGYRQYVEERLRLLDRQEQLAGKEREEEKKRQEKLRRIQQKVEHQQQTITRADPHGGKMLKRKMKAVKSMEHRFQREKQDMTELPDTEEAILLDFGKDTGIPAGKTVLDLTLPRLETPSREGETRVLAENIRLFVRGGEHIGIVGKNGAGKTTLLRKIAEELLPRGDLRAACMPQDYGEGVDQSLTPVEFLTKTGKKEELTRVRTFLGSVKYTPEEQGHPIRELSGGQKAKLFFLKMILDGNNVLILDEPTRNFSPLSGPVIRGILRRFPGCILSVSHDRKYLSEVCGRVVELTKEGLADYQPPSDGI